MKTSLFLEKMFGYLDEYPDTKIVATEKDSATPFRYISVDNNYGDTFFRLKLSNKEEMPAITISEFLTSLAGISFDATISAVSIDDGTIYNICDVFVSNGYVSLILKHQF